MLTVKKIIILLLKTNFLSDKMGPGHVGFWPEVIMKTRALARSPPKWWLPRLTAVKLFVAPEDKHICPFSLYDPAQASSASLSLCFTLPTVFWRLGGT